MRLIADTEAGTMIREDGGRVVATYPLYERESFDLLSNLWVKAGWNCKYSYIFEWMGRPIIQMPEDIVRLQQIIWQVKPDTIIETGVAHGGSSVFFASMLKLLGGGQVISIELEIRSHNRAALEVHPLVDIIHFIERSSTDPDTLHEVIKLTRNSNNVLVFLDSNHERKHVLRELEMYAPLVTPGSYIVVADGVMDILVDVPRGKPSWRIDNPAKAVEDFLADHPGFELEEPFGKMAATYFTGGYIRRRH